MLLMTIFGGSALLLAAIGIYGLMAYSVEQRTQEIGIRLALGAETGAVRNMVVLQGMRLVLIGVASGSAPLFDLHVFLRHFSSASTFATPWRLPRFRSRYLCGAARDLAAGAAGQPAGSHPGPALRISVTISDLPVSPTV